MSVFRALYLSLIVHMMIYFVISLFPQEDQPKHSKRITEIELINKPFKKEEQQIVRQAVIPDKLKFEDDSKARFMSQQRQRVLLETRAKNTGLTHNADSQKPQLEKMDQAKSRQKDLSGYEPIRFPRPNEVLPEAPSTVGESLPQDVAIGSFTALNTDRFQFYSFYSRIEELVRFRWETQVRNALDSFDEKYLMLNISRRNWITHIEFLLTPDGHLKTSRIMKASGVKGFDEAAVAAFQDARFFPNPPKELVEADGYVHLKYTFNVYFEPTAMAGGR